MHWVSDVRNVLDVVSCVRCVMPESCSLAMGRRMFLCRLFHETREMIHWIVGLRRESPCVRLHLLAGKGTQLFIGGMYSFRWCAFP